MPERVALSKQFLKVVPSDAHELRPRSLVRSRPQPSQPAGFRLAHGRKIARGIRPRRERERERLVLRHLPRAVVALIVAAALAQR
jgi:hypothetical protein